MCLEAAASEIDPKKLAELFWDFQRRVVADLPAIVRRSAQNVRAARTLTAARTAVKVAIATIDAKLKLLTVADADARDPTVRSAHYVADALNVAEVSLTRVSGL